jgi:hypothetical protein
MRSEADGKLPDGARFSLQERAALTRAFQLGWKKVTFAVHGADESQARHEFAV